MSPRKLLLIDLSAIFWWMWHATAGQEIDAAYRRTVEKVRGLATGYDHVAICCDSGKSFRKEMCPEYKANRPPKEPAALEQARRVEETLDGDGFHMFRAEGFEGDDIIARVAAWGVMQEMAVTIAGNDKDLLQLVGNGVAMLNLTKNETWTEATVKEKMGVQPYQMRDYLALVGDKADNIKGADGIGPVKAAALLKEFGSIASIYDKIEAVLVVSTRQALLDCRKDVELAQKLIALRADAPIDCDSLLTAREVKDAADPDGTGEAFVSQAPSAVPAGATLAPLATTAPEAPDYEPGEKKTQIVRQAYAPTDPRWALAFEPNDAEEAWKMAHAIVKSRLYSKFTTQAQVFAVVLKGRSLGIDMMTALDGIHVIDGKPSLSAALIMGCVLRSGKAKYFSLRKSTSEEAVYKTHRVGDPDPVEMSFDIKDAELAGLLRNGSTWKKYPKTMLRWRCVTELARAVYPDIVSNVYSPDELGDTDYVPSEIRRAG